MARNYTLPTDLQDPIVQSPLFRTAEVGHRHPYVVARLLHKWFVQDKWWVRQKHPALCTLWVDKEFFSQKKPIFWAGLPFPTPTGLVYQLPPKKMKPVHVLDAMKSDEPPYDESFFCRFKIKSFIDGDYVCKPFTEGGRPFFRVRVECYDRTAETDMIFLNDAPIALLRMPPNEFAAKSRSEQNELLRQTRHKTFGLEIFIAEPDVGEPQVLFVDTLWHPQAFDD